MREVYKEEDFYKDKGWPSERLVYSKYNLNIVGDDYDQFIWLLMQNILILGYLPEEGIVNFLVEALL